MTDAETEALLAEADALIKRRFNTLDGRGLIRNLVRRLATALRHSREELRAARDRNSLFVEYVEFLNRANEGPITMASVHGWRCSVADFDRGIEFRKRLLISEYDAARTARSASEEKL